MLVATRIRKGNILKIDGGLFRVMEVKHVTPGKGHAHVQVRLRNLKIGNQLEKRYNSGDKVEKAHLETRDAEFLYEADGSYCFMDSETYEQISLDADIIGDSVQLLLPNTPCQLVMHDGTTLGVELPKLVELEVTETTPSLKGATAAAQTKPATLETGLVIQVPPFITTGDKIRVDSESMAYVERAK